MDSNHNNKKHRSTTYFCIFIVYSKIDQRTIRGEARRVINDVEHIEIVKCLHNGEKKLQKNEKVFAFHKKQRGWRKLDEEIETKLLT